MSECFTQDARRQMEGQFMLITTDSYNTFFSVQTRTEKEIVEEKKLEFILSSLKEIKEVRVTLIKPCAKSNTVFLNIEYLRPQQKKDVRTHVNWAIEKYLMNENGKNSIYIPVNTTALEFANTPDCWQLKSKIERKGILSCVIASDILYIVRELSEAGVGLVRKEDDVFYIEDVEKFVNMYSVCYKLLTKNFS